MLPDHVALKRRVESKLSATMQRGVGSEGVLSMVSHQRLHEGKGFTLFRADGSVQRSEFKRHEATLEIEVAALEERGFSAVKEAMDTAVSQFSESGHKLLFDVIGAATSDRAVDAKGQAFTAELYLDGLETMEFSFDADGEWEFPTLVIPPGMMARANEQLSRIDSEEGLKQRLQSIVSKQQAAWRDREANRTLAD